MTPVARWKRQPIASVLSTGDERPHAVYSAYDATGAVIYIGISCEPRTRLKAHARAAWGREIDTWSADWYLNRKAAEAAEAEAIAEQRPRHNVYGTSRFRERCIEARSQRQRRAGM